MPAAEAMRRSAIEENALRAATASTLSASMSRMLAHAMKPPEVRDLVERIEALTDEVRELRDALAPRRSVLILGAEAEQAYRSLLAGG